MVRMGVVHIKNDGVDNVKSILLEEFDGTIVRIKNAEGYGTNMNNEFWRVYVCVAQTRYDSMDKVKAFLR